MTTEIHVGGSRHTHMYIGTYVSLGYPFFVWLKQRQPPPPHPFLFPPPHSPFPFPHHHQPPHPHTVLHLRNGEMGTLRKEASPVTVVSFPRNLTTRVSPKAERGVRSRGRRDLFNKKESILSNRGIAAFFNQRGVFKRHPKKEGETNKRLWIRPLRGSLTGGNIPSAGTTGKQVEPSKHIRAWRLSLIFKSSPIWWNPGETNRIATILGVPLLGDSPMCLVFEARHDFRLVRKGNQKGQHPHLETCPNRYLLKCISRFFLNTQAFGNEHPRILFAKPTNCP